MSIICCEEAVQRMKKALFRFPFDTYGEEKGNGEVATFTYKRIWQNAVLGAIEIVLKNLEEDDFAASRDKAPAAFCIERYDICIEKCKRGIEFFPCCTWCQMLLAHSYIALGNYSEALQTIETFFKIYNFFPEDINYPSKEDQGLMYDARGDIFALQEDYSNALMNYQNALDYYPAKSPEYKRAIEKLDYIKSLKNISETAVEQHHGHDIAQGNNNSNATEKIENPNQDESYF